MKPTSVFNAAFWLLASALALPATEAARQQSPAGETQRIGNDYIQAAFARQAGTWRLTRLARPDGTDALEMTSDEFEILLFDGQRFTVDAYEATGDLDISTENGMKILKTAFRRKASTSPLAPESVTVTYRVGSGPYLHKTVYLGMDKGGKVDRLQVLRFSTSQQAMRGGEGQPVYIGNWFLGMDYPGFYSRHSDGFKEPNSKYHWHYDLRKFRGQTVEVKGRLVPADNPKLPKHGRVPMEAWLVADRKVRAPKVADIGPIPFAIAQDYRRQTRELIPRQTIRVIESVRPDRESSKPNVTSGENKGESTR